MLGIGTKRFTALKKPPYLDIAQGIVQDQFEYWSGNTLQSGQPTVGSTVGMGISVFFRKLVGWTDTSRGTNLMNFMQAKGIPSSDASAIIEGKYKNISPPTWKILSYELQLMPAEFMEIRGDIAECASLLSEIEDLNRRSKPYGNRNNE